MNPVTAIIGAVSPLLTDIFNRAFPDKAAAAKAQMDFELQMQQALEQADLAQIDVNKTEAASESIFVAGWRPFIGWICGFALGYNFVLMPFMVYLISLYALNHDVKLPPLPTLDIGQLIGLLVGMLGMSGLRTTEKLVNTKKGN